MIHFKRILYSVNRGLIVVSGVTLVAAMVVICMNVFLRAFLGLAIFGSIEIIGYLAGITFSLALAHTAAQRGHITVEVLVSRLSPRAQAIVDGITGFLSMGFFALSVMYCARYATRSWQIGEISEVLEIPFFPFIYVVAFGCLMLCLVLLVQFIESLSQMVKK